MVSLAGISLFALACASGPSGPSGQKPSTRIVPASSIDPSTLVEYRALTRDDFRAERPSARTDAQAGHLGALLCASIGANSDLTIDLQPDEDPSIHWMVFRDAGYRARMDPTCSWWNSAQLQVDPEYVLEHEQIHFALLEISAREINREIASLRIRVLSRDRASAIAEASLKRVLEAARDRYVSQSQRFDEQTSPRPDREAQSSWRREVEARLSDRERGTEK